MSTPRVTDHAPHDKATYDKAGVGPMKPARMLGRRSVRVAAAVAGVALTLPSGVTLARAAITPSPAAAVAELTGYSTKATAGGLTIVYEDTSATVSKPVDASLPLARATFETGPFGAGLASLTWPGDTGGNFGAALQQLGIPQPVKDATKGAADPVNAASAYPGTDAQRDVSYPAAQSPSTPNAGVMHATATENATTADGSFAGFGAAPVLSTGSVTSHAAAFVKDAKAIGEAKSSVSNLNIGGVVQFDSVTSEAQSISDGAGAAKVLGTLVVGGVKVLGTPATIDKDGIHLATTSSPLGPVVNPVLDQALKALGFSAHLTDAQEFHDGTAASYQSGGLVIAFRQGTQSFTITMGQVFVASDASVIPSDLVVDPPTDPPVTEVPVSNVGGVPDPGAPAVDVGSSGGTAAIKSGPSGPTGATPTTAVRQRRLIASGGPIPGGPGVGGGIVFVGLIGVGLLFVGLKRMPNEVLGERVVGPACPNEGSPNGGIPRKGNSA